MGKNKMRTRRPKPNGSRHERMLDSSAAEVDRFWSHVEIKAREECWPWTRATNNKGYGQFSYSYIKVLAHRAAFLFWNGHLSDELAVCHSCDNPICCNPHHLWEGTKKDNMQDAAKKGRIWWANKTHCKHGHPRTPENLYISQGKRLCLICRKIRERKRAESLKLERALK